MLLGLLKLCLREVTHLDHQMGGRGGGRLGWGSGDWEIGNWGRRSGVSVGRDEASWLGDWDDGMTVFPPPGLHLTV